MSWKGCSGCSLDARVDGRAGRKGLSEEVRMIKIRTGEVGGGWRKAEGMEVTGLGDRLLRD